MRNIQRKIFCWGLLMVFLNGPIISAGRRNGVEFEQWDTAGDSRISEEEFVHGFMQTEIFEEWDADGSLGLDEDEFAQGVFETWDIDNNGVLTISEYDAGTRMYFEDYDYEDSGTFEDWDEEGDGVISYEEFRDNFLETGLFNEWDLDGNSAIDRLEFAMMLFRAWDRDGDGYLSREEFRQGMAVYF